MYWIFSKFSKTGYRVRDTDVMMMNNALVWFRQWQPRWGHLSDLPSYKCLWFDCRRQQKKSRKILSQFIQDLFSARLTGQFVAINWTVGLIMCSCATSLNKFVSYFYEWFCFPFGEQWLYHNKVLTHWIYHLCVISLWSCSFSFCNCWLFNCCCHSQVGWRWQSVNSRGNSLSSKL